MAAKGSGWSPAATRLPQGEDNNPWIMTTTSSWSSPWPRRSFWIIEGGSTHSPWTINSLGAGSMGSFKCLGVNMPEDPYSGWWVQQWVRKKQLQERKHNCKLETMIANSKNTTGLTRIHIRILSTGKGRTYTCGIWWGRSVNNRGICVVWPEMIQKEKHTIRSLAATYPCR